MLSELAGALDTLVEHHGARVQFIPFRSVQGDDDAEVCADLAGRMAQAPDVRVLPVPASPEAAGAAARSQLVVGTRLHSLILAAAAAVPAFGLDYMPKVRFFAERVGACGTRLISNARLLRVTSRASSRARSRSALKGAGGSSDPPACCPASPCSTASCWLRCSAGPSGYPLSRWAHATSMPRCAPPLHRALSLRSGRCVLV